MFRQFTAFLIFSLIFAYGCNKHTPDYFIDTVHGYLRCDTGLQDVSKAMIEICHEYGFKQLHSMYQGIGNEDDRKVLYGYVTSSYLIPGDKTVTLETVAEKGQPLHIRFKTESGGLYSQEEIMTELARRINILPDAKALEVKEPLENNKTISENNL